MIVPRVGISTLVGMTTLGTTTLSGSGLVNSVTVCTTGLSRLVPETAALGGPTFDTSGRRELKGAETRIVETTVSTAETRGTSRD